MVKSLSIKTRTRFSFILWTSPLVLHAHAVNADNIASKAERVAISEILEKLPTPEFRQQLSIDGFPSKNHVVSYSGSTKEDALKAFFDSYGAIPPNVQILLSYYAGNHQNHSLYLCSNIIEDCTIETIQELSDFNPNNAWEITQTSGGMVFGGSGRDRLTIEIPTERNGRLVAHYSYSYGVQQNDLRDICTHLSYYESGRFWGEKEPVSAGSYCYNFALETYTSGSVEHAFGYIPNETTRAQLRHDFKTIIGIDLAAE